MGDLYQFKKYGTLLLGICSLLLLPDRLSAQESIVETTYAMQPIPDVVTPARPSSLKWVSAVGEQSCSRTCRNAGMKAVKSGNYTPLALGGRTKAANFYICAADAQDEGFRGGYNTSSGVWQSSCTVGWGGAETSVTPYKCLCNR